MVPRGKKGQPRGRAQPSSHSGGKTRGSRELEGREEARVPWSGHPAKVTRTNASHAAADQDWPSDDARDSDASSISTGSTAHDETIKRSGRYKLVPYAFSKEQEGELVAWYRSHPELYDRNHPHYRDKERKSSLLESKAQEFPKCTYAQICLWFKSQRTRYGKLSQSWNRSGSNRQKVTARQQWIMSRWDFIKPHIVRMFPRESPKKFYKKKPPPSMSSEEESDGYEATSGSTPSTSQQPDNRGRTSASSPVGSIPTSTEVDEGGPSLQELLKTVIRQATEVRGYRQPMKQPKTVHERTVDTFLEYLKTEVLKIPENLWFNYTMDAMTMAHNYTQLKEAPSVDDLPDRPDEDDERPVVVVLKKGDLTQEEAEKALKEDGAREGEEQTAAPKEKDEDPGDGRIIFRKPTKRSQEDSGSSGLNASSSSSSKKVKQRERKQKSSSITKIEQNSNLLSFEDEDEDEEDT